MTVATVHLQGDALSARRVDRLRDDFLSRSTDDLSGLRPIIARSWRRSRAAGVDPTNDFGVFDEGRVDERTLAIAEPHLRRLDQMVQDLGGFVSLTAPSGALIRPDFLRDDDFPVGYSLLESSCGSNGEGLALEEGRAVWLAPLEHFREDMRENWCFASLVRDPFHSRVRAVVGMTIPAANIGDLDPASTLLMLEGVTARIEREVEMHTASRERTLLREYLTVARRRASSAVIAVDGKHSYMNAVATGSLDAADLTIVAGYAKEVMSSALAASFDVMLSGGRAASVDINPVRLSPSSCGAISVVRVERERSGLGELIALPTAHAAEISVETPLVAVHGQSVAHAGLMRAAQHAIDERRSVVLVGEPGTGKRRIAEAILAHHAAPITVDARGGAASLEDALVTMERSGSDALIVTHADALTESDACSVAARVRAADDATVVLTAERPTRATDRIAEASRALEIVVGPLRRRREDIPVIAAAIASEAGERRLSRRLMATLSDADWPGNVRQLRQVIVDAAQRARGIEITDDDLPTGFNRTLSGSRLSRLEDAELVEIRSALREAEGNRRLAAEILEIGRSTLYRRMDYFRSRGFEL